MKVQVKPMRKLKNIRVRPAVWLDSEGKLCYRIEVKGLLFWKTLLTVHTEDDVKRVINHWLSNDEINLDS